MRMANMSLRQVLALMLLFAFSGTNYAVQTHVHLDYVNIHGAASVTKAQPGTDHRNPRDTDEKHCPLCQAFFLAGKFVASVPLILAAPLQMGVIEPIQLAICWVSTLSHYWHGRGPPPVL